MPQIIAHSLNVVYLNDSVVICKCYYLKDGYHVFILEDDSEKKIPESEADVQLDIATGNKSPADVLRDRGDSRKI
jgi:hypothetical protein